MAYANQTTETSRHSNTFFLFRVLAALLALALSAPPAMARQLPDISAPRSMVPPPSKMTPRRPDTVGTVPAAGASRDAAEPAAIGVPTAVSLPPVLPDRLPVVFVDRIKLQDDKVSIVRARFGQVLGSGKIATRMHEVILRGAIRVKELAPSSPAAPTRRRGTVSWTSVQNPRNGKKVLISAPLASRFSTEGKQVMKGQEVNARGDYGAVLKAIGVLYGDTPAAPAAVAKGQAAAPVQDATAAGGEFRRVDEQSGKDSSGAMGRSVAGGGLAGSGTKFKLPDTVGAAKTAAVADTMGTTTDGCTPRVDLTQGVVIGQSRLSRNGVAEGKCSDTEVRYPVSRSYVGCTDKVEAATGKAWPQFRNFWTDAGGTTNYIGGCTPDTDQAFDLVEDGASCTVSVDMATLKATPRSQRVYTNRANQVVVVAACRPTPGAAAIPVTQTESGCSLRNDFAAGVSYQQERAYYVRTDGVQVIAETCSDTGKTYAQKKMTTVCPAVIDKKAGLATRQVRTRINKDGATIYVDDCTPDPTDTSPLVETGAGCETVFYNYPTAGQSYGASRWYDTLDGSPTYVTSCQQDDKTVYTHQSRTTGYKNDDKLKISKPMTQIYFASPIGEIEVSATAVRAGAPDLPYTLARTQIKPTGKSTYTGCDRYDGNANYNVWTRSDATEYSEYTSAAAATGPSNVCTAVTTWKKTSQSYTETVVCDSSCQNGLGDKPLYTHHFTAKYAGMLVRTRTTDNVVVVNATATHTWAECTHFTGYSEAPNVGILARDGGAECSSPPPRSTTNAWDVSLGWN